MSWGDRDYSTENWGGRTDFLSEPTSILSYSIPFGTWFGARVRLHLWLLLSILFGLLQALQTHTLAMFPVIVALVIASLMWHEFGHRVAAQWVQGQHDEFMLWPAGGKGPVQVPTEPRAVFIGYAGGIAANLLLCAAAAGTLAGFGLGRVAWQLLIMPLRNPLAMLGGLPLLPPVPQITPAMVALALLLVNASIVLVAVLPYYWFDGGYLLQAMLWPRLGLSRAISLTCIVGMVLAVPMFLLSLMAPNLMGMIMWVLLFSSSYTRLRQLRAEGTNELDDAVAHSASWRGEDAEEEREPVSSRERRIAWRRRAKDQSLAVEEGERERIDAILAKISQSGMESLTWRERRALKRATRRRQGKPDTEGGERTAADGD